MGLRFLSARRPWLWIGLGIFAISLSMLAGVDLLGWQAKTNVWVQPAKAIGLHTGSKRNA